MPVERSLRGAAPQFLGKDEVASSNLASSSKRNRYHPVSVLFIYKQIFKFYCASRVCCHLRCYERLSVWMGLTFTIY